MRRRLLWIAGDVPDRWRGGAQIRTSHLIEQAAAAFDIHLLTIGDGTDSVVRGVVTDLTEVSIEELPPKARLERRELLRWMATGRESLDSFFSDYKRDALRPVVERLRSGTDIVHVDHGHLSGLLPARRTEAWCLSFPHLDSEAAAHGRAIATTGRRRLITALEERRARRREKAMVDEYDLAITVSAEDDLALGGTTAVVPNGVDDRQFAVTPRPAAPKLVFTAHLAYPPNVDAAVWFCEAVFPLVQQIVPEATFDIVGRVPAAEVRQLADRRGVFVHADVPDVVPYLEGARVAVVPLRVGSGTRLKALEAMAAGRPVAGTTVGLAGLGIRDGEHALVADEPEVLAKAIARLLADDPAVDEIISAARAIVEQRYSWERVGALFVEALSALP